MCVIIIKKDGLRLPKGVAKTSARINPDGLGIIWLDTFEVEHHKSSAFKKLETERPFIAHFRYATVGKVGKSNTHPFQCGNKKDEWLMMNGTIRNLGNHDVCDSRVLAENIGSIPRKDWKSELEKHDSRFVTINTRLKTYQVYNKQMWTQRDGIWYSKDNVLERHLVAVYGTLRKNNSNYYSYLASSRHVGKGETTDKYPLILEGLPYLIDAKGEGHNVEVDVFKVSDSKLRDLDALEGHPNWYCRKQIPIKVGKETYTCWIYFNKSVSHVGKQMHKSYNQNTGWNWYSTDKNNTKHGWYGRVDDKPKGGQLSWWDEKVDDNWWETKLSNNTTAVETNEFDILNEKPICIDCFNDLEFDGFANYHCNSCGIWLRDDEVLRVNE